MPNGVKKWCFTLNNPTQGEKDLIAGVCDSEHVAYAVIGREVGDSGTPHLQGFVWFSDRKSMAQAKALISNRAHFEAAQGTPQQASDYCKKENDYDEYGAFPTQGSAGQWDAYKTWLLSRTSPPTETEICLEFPSLYGRYRTACLQMSRLLTRVVPSVEGTLRPWQEDLESLLESDPDDRTVLFRVDAEGGSGKTWFTKYWLSKHLDETQLLRVGKRDDLAHAIDEHKRFYFFDVPRGSMEHFQYAVLEQLKDRVVFSPKYDSTTKLLTHTPHVVVFCNEHPDLEALSSDRYSIEEV